MQFMQKSLVGISDEMNMYKTENKVGPRAFYNKCIKLQCFFRLTFKQSLKYY